MQVILQTLLKKHKWLGYLGLFVILIISLQLIIGGLVNYEVLSINEKFKFLFCNMIDFCVLGSGLLALQLQIFYLKNTQFMFLIKQEVQEEDHQIKDLKKI